MGLGGPTALLIAISVAALNIAGNVWLGGRYREKNHIKPERAASFDRILQGYIRQGFDPKDAIAAAKVASGDTFGYSGPALASNYKDGGMYVMGSNVFPFMFY
jgi:hypothetical protein